MKLNQRVMQFPWPDFTSIVLTMKLTVILLITAFIQVSAKSFSQQVTIHKKNISVEKALQIIEQQTSYNFLFKIGDLSPVQHIDLDMTNVSIEQALDNCFRNTALTYKIINRTILVKRKNDPPETNKENKAAPVKVQGAVTDEKGNPLPGVSVKLKGTTKGAITDVSGKFSLEVENANSTLIFSFIGFTTQEVLIDGRSELNILLKETPKDLSEVIVVGYGSVKKSDLTGSVSSISSEKITQVKAVSNVAQTLQGQLAGVQVTQRSGQPGESMTIKIRGTNSIAGGNDPLYVIDGLPTTGISAQLNTDDIASIDVLKDASSTAIYGSRGANGVVLITTKKGKSGKVQVSYDGYYGVQSLRKKKALIDATEFAQLQNEVATNDAKPLPYTQQQINGLGKGTDWQSLVYKPNPVQSHTLAFSGGSESSKYYLSAGYFNQDGIIENSSYRRLSLRFNLDQKLSEKLNFSTNASIVQDRYIQSNYTNADFGGIPFQTEVMPATQGVRNADGTYSVFTGVSYGQTNPVGVAKESYNPSNTVRIQGNAALTFEILPGLKLKSSAGIDSYTNKFDSYNPPTITFGQPGGNASKGYTSVSSFVNENTLNYNHDFDKHHIDAVIGFTDQYDKSDNLSSGTASGFVSTIYQDNNIQAALNKALPSTGYSDRKLLSYLGRVNYNYRGKYLATFTGRYDGSSVFGENNKFAFFPSGALAWRVSEEDFLKNSSVVSNLKLRGSYGASGNQAIGSYNTLSRVNNVNVYLGNQINTGYVLGSLPNPDLKWETTYELDLGVDFGILKDRVQFVADYYQKKTKNLLLSVTLPPSSGFGSATQNVGSTQNRGFEFQVISQNIIAGDFRWSSNLTFSRNVNKVLDLGKDAMGKPILYKEVGTGGNWFPMIVGKPMQELFGQQVVGVYQTDQEAVSNGEAQKHAGDYKFLDYNHDGKVDDNDKHVLSHLSPKFTGGFNNTFTYKNIDLSLLFVGSYGNQIANEFRKYNITMNGNWTPTQAAYDARWRGPGTSNTIDKPSANSGASIRNDANSTWLENGSYLKLRDVTIGYTFPKNVMKLLKVSSIRLFISAQNFFTLTKYSGYDPEVSYASAAVNGWDRGNYPSTKSITGGVKVKF